MTQQPHNPVDSGFAPVRYVPAERPKKKGQHPVKPELNVIPLVDVMFMMILFFVLGARFRQNEGQIPATLPQVEVAVAKSSDKPPDEHPKPINVSILSGGNASEGVETISYKVEGVKDVITDPEELYQKLAGLRVSVSDKAPIIIHPPFDTKWQYAVEVFNQAVRAQFKSIGFATS